jgi:hypothetical protein
LAAGRRHDFPSTVMSPLLASPLLRPQTDHGTTEHEDILGLRRQGTPELGGATVDRAAMPRLDLVDLGCVQPTGTASVLDQGGMDGGRFARERRLVPSPDPNPPSAIRTRVRAWTRRFYHDDNLSSWGEGVVSSALATITGVAGLCEGLACGLWWQPRQPPRHSMRTSTTPTMDTTDDDDVNNNDG